jgi:hypothetical protein
MKVRKIAGTCHDGACPTIYASETGSVIVQGYTVNRAEGMTLAEGEQAVEIPADLLRAALEGLA